MNVDLLQGMSLDEFLDWEREQPLRYEFDGVQPIPMTGGTLAHARLVWNLVLALDARLAPPHEAIGGGLKVKILATGRVRYPDALVFHAGTDPSADIVAPVVVFEILSPFTAATDLRVKPEDYASVPSIDAYVILSQDGPEDALVPRRSGHWAREPAGQTLELPEIGVEIAMTTLYP